MSETCKQLCRTTNGGERECEPEKVVVAFLSLVVIETLPRATTTTNGTGIISTHNKLLVVNRNAVGPSL